MARSLPTALHVARQVLGQSLGWLMFVEVPRVAGGYYRLVQSERHWSGDGKVWQAASISLDLPDEDRDGSLAELALTIPNVSRLPMAAVELDGELLGQDVTVWLQHAGSLSTFTPALSWRHRILRVSANEAALRCVCGHPAALTQVPKRRFTRGSFPMLLRRAGVQL